MPRSSNRELVPHTGFGLEFGLVDGSKKDMNDRHATQSWLGLGLPCEQADALGWSAAHIIFLGLALDSGFRLGFIGSKDIPGTEPGTAYVVRTLL